MSIYVVDCNVFSQALRNLSLDVFRDDIYTPWSDGMNSGKIISVDEVCRELDKYWGVTVQKEKRKKEGAWLAQHKSAFQPLTDEEGVILAGIFMNPKFREGIKEKSLREGSPEADAILVEKQNVLTALWLQQKATISLMLKRCLTCVLI